LPKLSRSFEADLFASRGRWLYPEASELKRKRVRGTKIPIPELDIMVYLPSNLWDGRD
jgi:hypothetical protein